MPPLVCRQGLGNCYFKVAGWLALTSHGDCDAGMQGVVGRLTTFPAKVMVQAPHQILVLGTVRVLKTPGLEAPTPLSGDTVVASLSEPDPCVPNVTLFQFPRLQES